MKERLDLCRDHLKFSLRWKGDVLGVVETRRHYTNYFKNIPNFKEYRMRLVTANDPQDIFDTLNEVELQFGNYQFV